MREEINEKFDRLTQILDKDNPTYETRKYSYDQQKESDLDAVKSMEDRRKRSDKKKAFHSIDDKIDQLSKSRTTKTIVDFCVEDSIIIKSFAVKEKRRWELQRGFCMEKC